MCEGFQAAIRSGFRQHSSRQTKGKAADKPVYRCEVFLPKLSNGLKIQKITYPVQDKTDGENLTSVKLQKQPMNTKIGGASNSVTVRLLE